MFRMVDILLMDQTLASIRSNHFHAMVRQPGMALPKFDEAQSQAVIAAHDADFVHKRVAYKHFTIYGRVRINF
jgi:hypothetical protein